MRMRHPALAAFAFAWTSGLVAGGCELPERPPRPEIPAVRDSATGARTGSPREGGFAAPEAVERQAAEPPLVVFLGDSLTAGLSLEESEAYPAVAGGLLAARGLPIRVRNAGVSGDTSAGGLERLDWFLRQRPAVLFVCLGANDGLRGQPVDAIAANLRQIIERARAAGALVVLAGIRMPLNYGPEYTSAFEAVFPELAREYELPFVPFLLAGVATEGELNLPDGLHPNAAGHRVIARTVAEALQPVLAELEAPRSARAGEGR